MVQQTTVCKFSKDDYYCLAFNKYTRELAIWYRNFTLIISTGNKSKIKCRELGCPILVVTCGKKLLVVKDQIIQSADHDFTYIMLVPIVVIINDLPSSFGQSWYHGKPYVYIKITETEPSSAVRNSVEIKRALMKKFCTKENIPPIIIIYTDGAPEHHTHFLSVKIAIILL